MKRANINIYTHVKLLTVNLKEFLIFFYYYVLLHAQRFAMRYVASVEIMLNGSGVREKNCETYSKPANILILKILRYGKIFKNFELSKLRLCS